MRITVLVAGLVASIGLTGCSKSNPSASSMPMSCDSGDTLVYTNRFVPTAGGSGVATGPDAANGAINSDSSGGGGGVSGGGISEGAPALAPSPTTSPPSTKNPTSDPVDGPITAMVTSCQPSVCDNGQVAVEVPPMPAPIAEGGPVGAPTTGAAPAGGTDDAPARPISTPSAPPVMLAPPGTMLCVDPPPSCPDGQSPQFNSKGSWECTDCALVVTYGGIYGNYRRCVNEPTIVCPQGETPTWVFEDEQWECKTTCDNGQYDQHTVANLLVCVPC